MTKIVDAVIGGGGMVGLTLGIALARCGLDVVVADPVPEAQALAAGFDGRVSALAFASVRMFKALGIWEYLAPHAQPIEDILVTDAKLGAPPSPFSLHFDHRELGAPLGYIAENRHIRSALFAAARGVTNLKPFSPAALVDLETTANSIDAHLGDGTVVPARLAVAADGRESPIRASMGIGVVSWSYPQWGIVAT
ncbi:MAG: FAD-dependent monooxygenase, partial [Alphaproteobacteria bacterium]|nr:FAD-dependent monooxygenase [Alphaproteobacteria bacterium]